MEENRPDFWMLQIVHTFQAQQYALVLKNYMNHFIRNLNLSLMGVFLSLTWAPVSNCPAGWVRLMLLFGYYSHWANLALRARPSFRNPLCCSPVVSVSPHRDQCRCLLSFYHWHLLRKVIQECGIQKHLVGVLCRLIDSEFSSVLTGSYVYC